jgi:branched-chain amino acid transport system substrate-binding protein
MENGFKQYLSGHGQKLGGKRVELVEVDEGDTPQSGVAAATRLVQQDRVDVVVGIVAGPTATGRADIFTSNKVPVILGNTGAVSLAKEKASPWIWRASYDNGDPGRYLAPYLAKKLPADQKVYLMAADYSGGHETIDGFKEKFPADRIAGETYTPFGKTSDYSPFLAKIRQSGAKTVFSFYAGAEAIAFTKQFNQFGLSSDIKLYSAGFLTEGSALDAEGDTALGVLNVTRYNWDLKNAANQTFAAEYQKANNGVPTVYAANMYDIAVMLDQAIGKIKGEVTAESINNQMGSLGTVQGVRGSLEFDGTTRTVKQDFALVEVQKTPQGLRNVTLETLPRP